MIPKFRKQLIATAITTLLNSYSLLFFSNNRIFGFLLLLVSFFNPYAGLTGLIAAVISITMAFYTGLNQHLIRDGLYSYNAVIIGLGMGTLYNFSSAFFLLLFIFVVFSVIISALLHHFSGKYGLPFLTVPFVLCFWLLMLVTKDFSSIHFTYRNIFWINDLYALGNRWLVSFIMYMENMPMPELVSAFFRAMSSLYFQSNILAGMLITLGMLVHSRIIFSLIIVGFLAAYGFNHIVNADGVNNQLLGINYILVSVAIGGFFTIPSAKTYLWVLISVPITFLIVTGLGKIIGQWNLPVYSMPFSITTICLLFFFSLKSGAGSVVLTPWQYYSPEKNLYNYLNNKNRLLHDYRIRLQLPFIGNWMVSQGYSGSITHKGEWSKALDFIIVDSQLKTYAAPGTSPEDFYCFGKPVLAPGDGFVQQVLGHIDDNEIGRINKQDNWGNSIVIKHAEGLYTKISHLKKNSLKVQAGDYVKKADIIALCGNSGRSPEPHLHFQVQATAHIGSKTMAYPFAFFVREKNGSKEAMEFAVPQETDIVCNATPEKSLQKAFEFSPGYNMYVTAGALPDGRWEVFTDAWNNSYIYCHNSRSMAFFRQNENLFYFTSFSGDKTSLLYYFFLACYKVYYTTTPQLTATDVFPLQLNRSTALQWLQDFISPFYIFSKLHYQSYSKAVSNDFLNPSYVIQSTETMEVMGSRKAINQFSVIVKDNRIVSFTFIKNNKTINAICTTKEY